MMMNFKKNQNNAVCSMDCKNCPNGASSEESGKCEEQKRAGGGRLRQRQDEVLA